MNLDTFRNAFSQGPVCIFLWDNITGIWPVADVTPNVEDLTGWPASYFVDGRVSFAELIHPEDLARVGEEEDAWKEKRSTTGINMKYRILTRSGAVRHVSEFTQNVFDESGEITQLTGYVVDVTEHCQSEEARIAAEQAAEAKSQFLANMSHEIRTPMNGVMGLAELLKHSNLSEQQVGFADMILRSGSALLTVINDLLDFSKISSGQLALDPMPFNLSETVQDAMAQFELPLAEKGLHLSVNLDPMLPKFFIGDPDRVHQIITNIVGNAVKFTHHGKVSVDVAGRVGAGNVATVDFVVTDTGIGIPACKQETIFEMFSQADGSKTREHEGLGLGLSIATALIEQMGGSISVESLTGIGSSFSFTLKLPVEGEADLPAPLPEELQSSRILVVGNPQSKTAMLEQQVAEWGFETALVSSGAEAIAYLHSAKRRKVDIDLAIIDDHVRILNGLELVEAIRYDAAISNTPLVVLADIDESRDIRRFERSGAQEALKKSVTATALRNVVVEALLDDMMAKVERDQVVEEITAPSERNVDVLIVEDNIINQVVLKQILLAQGCSVEIASNGEEGIELYKSARPGLICMDVSMPVMNGLDATRAIRALEILDGSHTPIIGVTAHAINGDKDRCIAAGMDDYIAKPISPKDMYACLKRWLDWDGELVETQAV